MPTPPPTPHLLLLPGPAGTALRRAVAADVPALAALYAAAAAARGPAVYAPEQVAAWVAFGADTPAFRAYVLDGETWVAVATAGLEGPGGTGRPGRPVGFSGWTGGQAPAAPEPPHPWRAELRSLYVEPGLHRRGIGAALLAHGLARAAACGASGVEAWVTPVSRPVFERAGFVRLRTEHQVWGGVVFERQRVGLDLRSGR